MILSMKGDLLQFLRSQFAQYVPATPESVSRSRYDVTLSWGPPGSVFSFLEPADLLYKLQKKEKLPPWSTVYSGGRSRRTVENLAPGQAHVFRVRVVIKPTSVPHLATRAIRHYGSEQAVFDHIERELLNDGILAAGDGDIAAGDGDNAAGDGRVNRERSTDGTSDDSEEKSRYNNQSDCTDKLLVKPSSNDGNPVSDKVTNFHASGNSRANNGSGDRIENTAWWESSWSEHCWCSTEPPGASVVCFCMAVRCGYIKQVQQMLEERPELLEIVNSVNGLTPLITAINKGELSTVKYLLNAGADVGRPAAAGHTPLQLALLAGQLDIAGLLLERGADIAARDLNGLRAEHYAVDSGCQEVVTWLLDRGGELEVRDNQGWTPLFRAVSQGASCELIAELLRRGADVTTTDHAGLTLPDVARLLKDPRGGPRDSVVRLVDPSYPHERALDHFTRLTKKIYSVQTVFK